MSKRPYIGPSESQSEALVRRESPYTAASGVSFKVKWDWTKREPTTLREAAMMVRKAYSDEVPTRMHNRDLADDGTPKMTAQAESFICDDPNAGTEPWGVDREGNPIRPAIDYYKTPFRAALAKLETDSAPRADLVRSVATGEFYPTEAAIELGVPAWCAKIVAKDVLFAFMRSLSDLKISLPPVDNVA